jgi:hypothetical protein
MEKGLLLKHFCSRHVAEVHRVDESLLNSLNLHVLGPVDDVERNAAAFGRDEFRQMIARSADHIFDGGARPLTELLLDALLDTFEIGSAESRHAQRFLGLRRAELAQRETTQRCRYDQRTPQEFS